jgi:pectinacetylesterase
MRSTAWLLAAALSSAACAPNTSPITKKAYPGVPPLGAPFTIGEAPDGVWSWVPFPASVCADGSPTGLGVNPGTGPDLVVFFDGGGACWDYLTCAAVGTAVDEDYGAAKFDAEVSGYFPGSFTDRAALPPQLADATLVFVPYCTGDVHGGGRVATYRALGGLDSERWSHLGHGNVLAFLERLGATWPSPRKLVVAGSSAGGFGAVANYEAFKWYWPDADGYLVDDSGPPLVGDDIPGWMRDAWYNAWGLGVSLDPFCAGCRTDLSAAVTELARRNRGDRFAFLSHTQDGTMSLLLGGKTGSQFEEALRRAERSVFAPTENARVFLDAGSSHMLLTALDAGAAGYLASHETGGVRLDTWLGWMMEGSPEWITVVP